MSNFNNLVIPSCEEYAEYLFDGCFLNGVSFDFYETFIEAWNRQIREHRERQVENE